jgi:hypothetical protein
VVVQKKREPDERARPHQQIAERWGAIPERMGPTALGEAAVVESRSYHLSLFVRLFAWQQIASISLADQPLT